MYAINEIGSCELSAWQREGKTFVLVDVRTPGEMMRGIISGGRPMPLNRLPGRVGHFSNDVPTVFYCRTGVRSAQATAFMMARGFEQTYNLRGGIMDWVRQGMPIEAPTSEWFGDPGFQPVVSS